MNSVTRCRKYAKLGSNCARNYWKATKANQRWQLIIYDAIIRSKLLYGLEALQLTEAMSKKLDTFQLKGLRQILRLETTFINRANSNKQVFEVASSIAYPDPNDTRRVKRGSVTSTERGKPSF